MGIFDKFFGKKKEEETRIEDLPETNISDLNPDERFVQEFKNKGGKFLYCTSKEEVLSFLKNIVIENTWEKVMCFDEELVKDLTVTEIQNSEDSDVFYTKCEHLIVDDGSILFSSNQLKELKLNKYPKNFIVMAKTSQLLFNKDEGLMSIKHRFKDKIPYNIGSIKDYRPENIDENFLIYGNLNSKNLYLILLEDL